MLSKPAYGWSEFQLGDFHSYSLSYLDDIAVEWVDQAIHGLETMLPFCVKGNSEPTRILCVVSYWHCHIITEEEVDRNNPDVEYGILETPRVNMLEFCQNLYDDVSQNLDEWASFVDYGGDNFEEKKEALTQSLARLKELIVERAPKFEAGCKFF